MASAKALNTQLAVPNSHSRWKTIWKYKALMFLALPGVLLMFSYNFV